MYIKAKISEVQNEHIVYEYVTNIMDNFGFSNSSYKNDDGTPGLLKYNITGTEHSIYINVEHLPTIIICPTAMRYSGSGGYQFEKLSTHDDGQFEKLDLTIPHDRFHAIFSEIIVKIVSFFATKAADDLRSQQMKTREVESTFNCLQKQIAKIIKIS